MNSNNNSDKSDTNETNVESLGSNERKTWIRFEERPQEGEIQIEMPSECGQSSGCATIEPTNSIHINGTNDFAKRTASSSVSNVSNILPQNQSNETINANIMSKIYSNKVIEKSFITNKNNENEDSIGESSNGTNSTNDTNLKTLQNVSLKEINNDNECNQCVQSAGPPNTGFSNGDVIVTVLPVNDHCSWLTSATFRPELVPEELMAQSLTLTVEDYVSAIQVLVNDLRFNLYITLYKRMLVIWIALGFLVLLALLFSGVKGLPLFVGGVLWLVINAFGIFITMYCKVKLYHLLERCISQVNAMLYKYNLLLGVDDKGHISCHKINLVFIYFDVSYCIKYLKDMLENESQSPNTDQPNSPTNTSTIISRMDINASDITITGATPKSLSQKEKYAEKLLLRYSQRWVKDYIRRRIDLNMPLHADSAGVSVGPVSSSPRHCTQSRCLCQFIEEHLKFKPLTKCNITEIFM